jgi:putative phosphoribosyl transferase
MPDPATHEGPGAPVTLVPMNGTTLPGHLVLPPSPIGLALIARLEHGGPASDAYGAIARAFVEKGFASFVVALDAANEAERNAPAGWLRGDVAMIAERMGAVIRWASAEPPTARLPIGLFGVDTVAAAALVVAASAPLHLAAVVGCNARTDLVDRVLGRIAVPTLLIAGTRATEVLAANRVAIQELRCEKRMVIAAGNLKVSLEGRGARKVGNLAARWLDRHVARRNSAGGMR